MVKRCRKITFLLVACTFMVECTNNCEVAFLLTSNPLLILMQKLLKIVGYYLCKFKIYLGTCPKNDVISFSRKLFWALGLELGLKLGLG